MEIFGNKNEHFSSTYFFQVKNVTMYVVKVITYKEMNWHWTPKWKYLEIKTSKTSKKYLMMYLSVKNVKKNIKNKFRLWKHKKQSSFSPDENYMMLKIEKWNNKINIKEKCVIL